LGFTGEGRHQPKPGRTQQYDIYTLMHRDSFPRFLNSSVYRDLLNSKRACLDT
ncbi:hypothetical protein M9458_026808, partial [Cirrhinus mrigala]